MLKALDLFCGGGGTCAGLQAAGFSVVGIDLDPIHRKRYPGLFICADALQLPCRLEDFDLIWASPPCQRFSVATAWHGRRDSHPDLIEPVRRLLKPHPFTVIENVPGAPIRKDIVLTGPTVGLPRIERRRNFEVSFYPGLLPKLRHVPRADWERGYAGTITTSMSATSHYYRRKAAGMPGRIPVAEAREMMGITHPMTGPEVGEAVPPPYAEFIARRALVAMGFNRSVRAC